MSSNSYPYDWTPNTKLSYGDFLRAKQLEGSIRYEIDNHHTELIATNQELSESGIEVLSAGLESGFTMLSQGMGQATEVEQEGGAEVVGTLNWGFSEALISQGRMNIRLDELVKLTRTNAQAWAFQQFENGRDEFRRQLYQEALQSATRAIEGQGGNQGNNTEFRFYFLLGIIRLGSYSNSSPEVINPKLAEQAFLSAARYAGSNYPADAGQSLICAGRAALVAGDLDNAITHTRKGLNLVPTHATGMYQLGRALFLKGARSEAADRLVDAILLNVEHALHAAGDPSFLSKMDFLNDVLLQAQEHYAARLRQVADRFRRAKQTLLDFSFRDVPAAELHLNGFDEIQKTGKMAEELAESKTLFACNAAISHLLEGFRLFPACFAEFKAHCVRHLQEQILAPPRREDFFQGDPEENAKIGANSPKKWLLSGIGSGIIAFLFQSSRTAQTMHQGILESLFDSLLIPLLFAVGIAAAVALLESVRREYLRAKQKSALAAFDAAWYSYSTLKNSLENEIAEIQGMSLPRECAPPLPENLAKPGATADASTAQKRVSAWARL